MRSLRWVDAFLIGLQDHHFPPPAAVTVYKRFCSFLLGHLLLEIADEHPDMGYRGGSQAVQTVAAFQHGDYAALRVPLGDGYHRARKVGEIPVGEREGPEQIADPRIEPSRDQ